MGKEKVVAIMIVKSDEEKSNIEVQSVLGKDAIRWMDYVNDLHQFAEQMDCIPEYDFDWKKEPVETFVIRSFLNLAKDCVESDPKWEEIIGFIKSKFKLAK
jgi:hypothetical protein